MIETTFQVLHATEMYAHTIHAAWFDVAVSINEAPRYFFVQVSGIVDCAIFVSRPSARNDTRFFVENCSTRQILKRTVGRLEIDLGVFEAGHVGFHRNTCSRATRLDEGFVFLGK
jgi:hypothetical protein